MNVICCYYRINKIENNNVIILGLNKINIYLYFIFI